MQKRLMVCVDVFFLFLFLIRDFAKKNGGYSEDSCAKFGFSFTHQVRAYQGYTGCSRDMMGL